jgi:hypothetical protein
MNDQEFANYRSMNCRFPDEDRLLFSDRCTRVSSDTRHRRGVHTHLLKHARGWAVLELYGPTANDSDKMFLIPEERAFEEYMEHVTSEGQLFIKMESAFSKEQCARIENM